MRVEVAPRRLSVVPGQPTVFTVQVFNTETVITGYRLRVLGLDPRWVQMDSDQLSLFPDTAGTLVLTVTLPMGIPAGIRQIGIETRELNPPARADVTEIELTVPAELAVALGLDPVSTTGGRSTTVGLLVENTGNSPLEVALRGLDEEGQVDFTFDPPLTSLAPGEQAVSTARLRAHRPWFGSPKIRPFTVEAGPAQPPVIAFGTWVQKPRVSRAGLALIGLLTAVTVFAVVIAASLSAVVDKSSTDRDLALQVAEASQSGPAAGHASLSGTVSLLTSGQAIGGVTVELFGAANTASPLVSTATGVDGGYHFAGLTAGNYKLRFRGAGFTELWYPQALTPDAAQVIPLLAAQVQASINVRLGGLPATVSGKVVGADPAGAVVTLEVPAPASAPAADNAASSAPGSSGAPPPEVVTSETLDASGIFTLPQIPSPSLYQLVVTETGYAPAAQEVDLGGGEQRTGIVITLEQGDGAISGTVATTTGPLAGATISASDGHTTVGTVSLTQGTVGSFVLNNLPTPDTFTVLVSSPGYATQTLSLTLTAAQQLSGVQVTLTTGVGSVSGLVTTTDGVAAGGVNVTVTNGQLSLQTVTLSVGNVGSYQVAGLPVPSTYTVTFSRPDLASQTQAISLTPASATPTGVDASLARSTAELYGVVSEQTGAGLPLISVQLNSGTTTYTVTSATVPTAGSYEIDGIVPGTYTLSFTRPGGVPASMIITLAAGDRIRHDQALAPAASIRGTVYRLAGGVLQPLPGAQVRLYQADEYPTVLLSSTSSDTSGNFTFANVNAPESYVVEFAYPEGSAGQVTALVADLGLGQAFQICGSPASTTTTTVLPTTTSTAPTGAGATSCPIIVSTG